MKQLRIALFLSLFAINAHSEPSTPQKLMTPRRKRLASYFGVSALATYVSMNVLNKNAHAPISQKRLLAYSTGIPIILGLGLYLGSLYSGTTNEEITQSLLLEDDFKKFLGTYAGVSTLGTWGFLCASSKLSGEPLSPGKHAIDACGYTGTSCGIASASYFASLLWAESGLMQDTVS